MGKNLDVNVRRDGSFNSGIRGDFGGRIGGIIIISYDNQVEGFVDRFPQMDPKRRRVHVSESMDHVGDLNTEWAEFSNDVQPNDVMVGSSDVGQK